MSAVIDKQIALEELKNLPVKLDAGTVQRCIEAISKLPEVDISHYALYYGECKGCKYRRVKVDICQYCARNCDDEYEEEVKQ